MGAVWLLARRNATRRWGALLVLAGLAALVSGVTLAGFAGARRTASALDRMLAATDARDFRVGVFGADIADELAAQVGDVAGVDDVVIGSVVVAGLPTEFDTFLVTSPDGGLGTRIDRPMVLAGRMPDPAAAHEVVINEILADELDLGASDALVAPTFSPEDWETIITGGEFPGFNGPSPELVVTGVVRLGEDLVGQSKDANPVIIATPAYRDAYGDEVAVAATMAHISVEDPAALDELRAIADGYAAERLESFSGTTDEEWAGGVRGAVRIAVIALILFSVVAGLAGAAAIAQTTSRQVAARPDDVTTRAALGLTRHEQALVSAIPAALALGVGTVAGAVLAFVASPSFPLAVAGRAEIDPGLSFDAVVLVVGTAVLVAVSGGWAYLGARRSQRRHERAQVGRAAPAWLPGSSSLTFRLGRDHALRGLSGPVRTANRAALVGVTIGAMGLAAVLVVGASLDAALATPRWWGWTWTTMPDVLDPSDEEGLVAGLAAIDELAAFGKLEGGSIELGGAPVYAYSLEAVQGDLSLALAEGRLPVSPTEVAIGTTVLDALDAEIGDVVVARLLDGEAVELGVVGRVAIPLTDATAPGDGVVVSRDLLLAAAPDIRTDLLLTYENGIDEAALEERLLDELALDTSVGYARPSPPSRLQNVDETVGLLPALAGFFALLALISLAHSLIVSSRAARPESGELAALGLLRRQRRRVASWQSVTIVAVGLVIGLPLGVVVGRLVWNLIVADLGMLGGPTTPVSVVVVIAGALIAAVALGWPVGRHFTSGRPADLLRAE